mgnify:CR=1 FL=1
MCMDSTPKSWTCWSHRDHSRDIKPIMVCPSAPSSPNLRDTAQGMGLRVRNCTSPPSFKGLCRPFMHPAPGRATHFVAPTGNPPPAGDAREQDAHYSRACAVTRTPIKGEENNKRTLDGAPLKTNKKAQKAQLQSAGLFFCFPCQRATANSFSMAEMKSASLGLVAVENACTVLPSRPTRYL